MSHYKRLEDYGIIGDLETSALVGRDGSIDWLCLPSMDSPSLFSAILDERKGGAFHLRPEGPYESNQSYVDETNVLVTAFTAQSGTAELTDFMSVAGDGTGKNGGASGLIVRKLHCSGGEIGMESLFEPKFDYGRAEAEVSVAEHRILATYQGERLLLEASPSFDSEGIRAKSRFRLSQGETVWFFLHYGDGEGRGELEGEGLLQATIRYWHEWLRSSRIYRPLLRGPWHDLVIRSALLLKLLTNARTGAVIAAPTTSLPESIGGIRNWDYRYSWVRDSAFTIQAFENLGYYQEALDYFRWLKAVCHLDEMTGGPPNIKVAYRFDGSDVPPEMELGHLSGYRNSSPVRVGNAAFNQVQMDVFGEIINSFYLARHYEKGIISSYWKLIHSIADHVCRSWNTRDSGIWELRSEPRHLTHSKLMCWVALDRSIRMAREFKLDGSVERWAATRDEIRNAVLTMGFSQRLNSFVQAFDYEVLDSSSLLIPIMGLTHPQDPRVKGTIEALRSRLGIGDFIRRYEGDDGLPGKEGAFILCSFWLVRALALSGQIEEAEDEFLRILKYKSPLGLFSEEIDPRSGLQIGNFPQAFSHIGLINSALYLGKYQGREPKGPDLIGSDEGDESPPAGD